MNTHCIILAAGPGSRLLPHTKVLPKCLVPVNNYPILHYQLSALVKNKIHTVTVVVGYKKNEIKKYIASHFSSLNCSFINNPLFDKTNTLYSLALAARKLHLPQTILLLNGDVIFDQKILKLLLKSNDNKSYTAAQYKPCGLEEIKFTLTSNGSIALLNKSVYPNDALGESIGINKFSPSFWAHLSKKLKLLKNRYKHEYFEYAIEKTIEEGEKLYPLDIKKLAAIEIDFPEDLSKASLLFNK